MKITTVLFDLDGTLLPMDQEVFIKAYFGGLSAKLAPHGYAPEQLIGTIWEGTKAMIRNDGSRTNEDAFWDVFCSVFGAGSRSAEPILDQFYHNEFQQVQSSCGYDAAAKETIALVKAKGLRPVLATNPIFPAIATESRIRWAGLQPEDFVLYTTYENANYCKPNLAYYRQILDKLSLRPGECLMVGNDVSEDMVTRELGMEVFLLTDCLINREEKDISVYPHGGFPQLMEYIHKLNT